MTWNEKLIICKLALALESANGKLTRTQSIEQARILWRKYNLLGASRVDLSSVLQPVKERDHGK